MILPGNCLKRNNLIAVYIIQALIGFLASTGESSCRQTDIWLTKCSCLKLFDATSWEKAIKFKEVEFTSMDILWKKISIIIHFWNKCVLLTIHFKYV